MSDTARATESTNASAENTTMLNITADFRFFPIIPLLQDPSKDLLCLYRFYRAGCNAASAATNSRNSKRPRSDPSNTAVTDSFSCVLDLTKTKDRHERRLVHSTIATGSNGMLSTTTLPENRIAVQWTPRARKKGKHAKQRETFTVCLVEKRQCENLVMLNTIARAFRCHVTDIGCAGIKDRQAITYQFCTIPRHLESKRVFKLNNNITVVSLGAKMEALRRGELHQNRFEITVRNVVGTFPPLARKQGMINFFGTQRVGEPGDPKVMGARTFEIGRAMLRGQFDVVINLLMGGRRVVNGKYVVDKTDFRQVWRDSGGDAVATYTALTKSTHSMPREQAVLKGLKRHGRDDPLAVIQCLPRNERVFFISAMATYRIQRYGDRVCKGDLVVDASGQVRLVGMDVQQYDLDQVVLPLPGFNVIYPENEVGERYKQELATDNIKFTKGAVEESTAKGSYRSLIARAENATLEEEPDGETRCVRLAFDLPTGAYATMLLREIMRTTVARSPENP